MGHVSYLSFYESPVGIIRINTSHYDVLSLTFIDEQTEEERENRLSIRVKEEYRMIAKELGNEEVISPVINVLKENPCPILIPCHRVVDDDSIGSYVSDIEKKEFLLNFESHNKEK